MTIKFAQFKRQMEAKMDRDFTTGQIAEGAGISADTVSRLLNDKVTRIDSKTINGLCRFFDVEPGPVPFIVYEVK